MQNDTNNTLRRDGLLVLLAEAEDREVRQTDVRLDIRVKGVGMVLRVYRVEPAEVSNTLEGGEKENHVQLGSFWFAKRPGAYVARRMLNVIDWMAEDEARAHKGEKKRIACGFPVVDAGVVDDTAEAAAAPGSNGSMLAGCELANKEGCAE